MKQITFVIIVLYSNLVSCKSEKITGDKKVINKNGVMIYFMNEPYFFAVKDTSFEKISKSNIVGLKLGKIDQNDILDSVSHKSNIIVYAVGDNNKTDTFASKAGVLPVKIVARPTETKLSPDTSAFAFVSGTNEWVFRYEIRFDMEVVSVTPVVESDIKAYQRRLDNLR